VIALLLLGLALNGFVPTLQTGDTVPPLPLVDQDGRAFSFADLRGNVVVVSFLFTACGDVNECPLLASKLGHMQSQIGVQPIRLERTSAQTPRAGGSRPARRRSSTS